MIWPDWAYKLRRGDILLTPAGTERIVRKVNRQTERRVYVHFTILNCSWTSRPVTVYLLDHLVRIGYTHTGHRIVIKKNRLNKRIDKETQCKGPPKLTCCDIKGIR